MKNIKQEYKILITGEGGQGIQTVGKILLRTGILSGWPTSYIPNFGVEQRGGVSLAFVRLKKNNSIDYPKFLTADYLLIACARARRRVIKYLDHQTKIFNFSRSQERPLNMIMLGRLAAELPEEIAKYIPNAIQLILGGKPGMVTNLTTYQKGLNFKNSSIFYDRHLPIKIDRRQEVNRAADKNKEHYIFPWLCKSCGTCLYRCPVKALHWSNKVYSIFNNQPAPEVDIKKCQGCGLCQKSCPERAIRVILS